METREIFNKFIETLMREYKMYDKLADIFGEWYPDVAIDDDHSIQSILQNYRELIYNLLPRTDDKLMDDFDYIEIIEDWIIDELKGEHHSPLRCHIADRKERVYKIMEFSLEDKNKLVEVLLYLGDEPSNPTVLIEEEFDIEKGDW